MDYYLENTKVFKALGDPKRAMIVDMLSCGEMCACNILEKFEMSQSTLSHHMKLLRESGLVKAREEGKWTYYSLNGDAIDKAKGFLQVITSDKEDCICRGNKPTISEGNDQNV
jgi:ArsR family transcriptional regulator